MYVRATGGGHSPGVRTAARTIARSREKLGMIDLRWPQQHYARAAAWAEQRFPLLQRLLGRIHAGDARQGDGDASFPLRTARAFQRNQTSTGAQLQGAAAVPCDGRRQASPDSGEQADMASLSAATSTAHGGALTERLGQRATRSPGVIDVQGPRQQARRAAGGPGHALPLLARHNSGGGTDTASGIFREAAPSAAATLVGNPHLGPRALSDDSLVTTPVAEPQHNRQPDRWRSVSTGTPVPPTFAGRRDHPPSPGLTAESSPLAEADLRIRRTASPAFVPSNPNNAPTRPTTMAASRQPGNDRIAGVVSPPDRDRLSAPIVRSTLDHWPSKSSAAIATLPAADFYPTPDAALGGSLPLARRTAPLSSGQAPTNPPTIPTSKAAMKPRPASRQQKFRRGHASIMPRGGAGDGVANLFRQAAGVAIQKSADTGLPLSIPSATGGAVRHPAPTEDHRSGKFLPSGMVLPADTEQPTAHIVRTAMDRTASDNLREISMLPTSGVSPTTGTGLRDTLPLAYRTPVPHAMAGNTGTLRSAVEPALRVIPEKGAAAGGTTNADMVWRKDSAASPTPRTGNAAMLEATTTATAATPPVASSERSTPRDAQPSPPATGSDAGVPGEEPDWQALIAQISRRILRQLTIERERRGVKGCN